MTDDSPPSRYRPDGRIFDTLHKQVRQLTDEISEARRELQRELPPRRRSDQPSVPMPINRKPHD